MDEIKSIQVKIDRVNSEIVRFKRESGRLRGVLHGLQRGLKQLKRKQKNGKY